MTEHDDLLERMKLWEGSDADLQREFLKKTSTRF
jgi:hypothetical protein